MTVITLDHIKARCIEEGDCWIWQGALGTGGYPAMRFNGGPTTGIRRVVSALDGRTPSKGQPVICTCDERLCVFPGHMKLTTRKMVSRKAAKTGYLSTKAKCAKSAAGHINAGHAKITHAIAAYIRESRETGVAMSKRFGINETQVSRIRRGMAWKSYEANPFEGLGARR